MRRYLAAVAIALAFTAQAWGGFDWRPWDGDSAKYDLLRDGEVVGIYIAASQTYHPRIGRESYGPPGMCPTTPPAGFGVDKSKLADAPKYSRAGKSCTRDEAMRAVESPALPDDSGKMHLTVIGSEADRKRVLDDLGKEPLAGLRGRLLVQSYPPDHWAVKVGFVTGGSPTIYVQDREGRVLHRQDSYTGPDALAGAIRRADPNYKPSSDPNGSKAVDLNNLIQQVPLWAWVAGGLAVVWYITRKETK